MNIGIVGLGLIGGSIAKAIKNHTDHTVFGLDLQESVVLKAKLIEAIDEQLTEERLASCDLIILALYPEATVAYIKVNQHRFAKGAMVVDCCGVKDFVCEQVTPLAEKNGFKFIGAHPMAGVEFSGFAHAQKSLFKNASMILTPQTGAEIQDVDQLKKLWVSIGFTNVEIATPKEHDRRIAFTSQLAHVVSSAYVKSPTAMDHKGFSAGSFRDLSRVAKLNAEMWTELFLLNQENLVAEIDTMISHLQEYRTAIAEGNQQELQELLQVGSDRKIFLNKQKK